MSEYLSIAVGFAGQGSQDVEKMRQTLLDPDSKYLKIMAEAAHEQGISEDLADVLRNAESGRDLAPTGYNQLLVSAHGLQLFDQMLQQRKLTREQIVAAFGLSIGEFLARHIAGEVSLKDLPAVIAVRAGGVGDVFKNLETEPSAQYAVMGNLQISEITDILAKYVERVWIGNYNSPRQIVIAGYAEEVAEAAREIKNLPQIKKVKKLETEGAFHTSILQPAADRLAKKLKEIEFQPADLIVPPNFEGARLTKDVRQSLINQLVNPVQFTENMGLLRNEGIKIIVTFDAKRILAGIVADNLPALKSRIFNISCPKDIENFDSSVLRAKEE